MTTRRYAVAEMALKITTVSPLSRRLAAAVTLTEMYYRPWYIRMVEYCWAGFKLLAGRTIRNMTLGISQVSVRHVMERRNCSELSAMRTLMHPFGSIEACAHFLEAGNIQSTYEAAKLYNGKGARLYARLLDADMLYVKEVEDRITRG